MMIEHREIEEAVRLLNQGGWHIALPGRRMPVVKAEIVTDRIISLQRENASELRFDAGTTEMITTDGNLPHKVVFRGNLLAYGGDICGLWMNPTFVHAERQKAAKEAEELKHIEADERARRGRGPYGGKGGHE